MSITDHYNAIANRLNYAAGCLAAGLAHQAGHVNEASINAWRFSHHPEVQALRRKAAFAAKRSAVRRQMGL